MPMVEVYFSLSGKTCSILLNSDMSIESFSIVINVRKKEMAFNMYVQTK